MLHSPQFIEPAGQPLRGTPRIDKNERGPVSHHFPVDLLFDKGPQGARPVALLQVCRQGGLCGLAGRGIVSIKNESASDSMRVS